MKEKFSMTDLVTLMVKANRCDDEDMIETISLLIDSLDESTSVEKVKNLADEAWDVEKAEL